MSRFKWRIVSISDGHGILKHYPQRRKRWSLLWWGFPGSALQTGMTRNRHRQRFYYDKDEAVEFIRRSERKGVRTVTEVRIINQPEDN